MKMMNFNADAFAGIKNKLIGNKQESPANNAGNKQEYAVAKPTFGADEFKPSKLVNKLELNDKFGKSEKFDKLEKPQWFDKFKQNDKTEQNDKFGKGEADSGLIEEPSMGEKSYKNDLATTFKAPKNVETFDQYDGQHMNKGEKPGLDKELDLNEKHGTWEKGAVNEKSEKFNCEAENEHDVYAKEDLAA